MRVLYSFIGNCLFPLLLARLWWRGRIDPAYRVRWQERLGHYRGSAPLRGLLWIHAVSVGEVSAAAPLVRALRERAEDQPILLTTTTPTGFDNAERMFGRGVTHVYFPYDLNAGVRRFLAHFAPRALLVMETELWPNLFHHCHAAGIPVFLINGRVSARSARRYRLIGPLTRRLLAQLTHAAMQTRDDAARLISLGADSDRVSVTGSLKFDVQIPASVYEEGAALRRKLGGNRPILMAGSTRQAEEVLLLEACSALWKEFPDLLLVLAPRHPERFQEVHAICSQRGLIVRQRSQGAECSNDTRVLLLDTMGELLRFYAASDVAFVGGSLVPLGGHNVLEPAGLGIPVVVGPYLFNFAAIAEQLAAGGALKVGQRPNDIASVVAAWLRDSDARDSAGRAGRAIVKENRGATDRVVSLLERYGVAVRTK